MAGIDYAKVTSFCNPRYKGKWFLFLNNTDNRRELSDAFIQLGEEDLAKKVTDDTKKIRVYFMGDSTFSKLKKAGLKLGKVRKDYINAALGRSKKLNGDETPIRNLDEADETVTTFEVFGNDIYMYLE